MTEIVKPEVVVAISGGLDSLLLEAQLVESGYRVYPIFLKLGQKNVEREETAIMSWNTHLKKLYNNGKGNLLRDVKVVNLSRLYNKSTRLSIGGEVSLASADKKDNFIPGRNIIILTIASSYADTLGISTLAIGSHREKLYPFPDSSPEFLKSLEGTLDKGYFTKNWKILTPWLDLGLFKSGVVAWGAKHDFPLDKTWTCYNNLKFHCGTCKSCDDRKTAFREAGVSDPTKYMDDK
jgi:7-cyano-7-deazaguanine synthase